MMHSGYYLLHVLYWIFSQFPLGYKMVGFVVGGTVPSRKQRFISFTKIYCFLFVVT